MRNRSYAADLDAWAVSHGLRPSSRTPCGHAILGRGLASYEHTRYCIGSRLDLLDHATVWNYKRTRIVLAFPYRPRPGTPEFPAYAERVERYVRALNIAAAMPSHKDPRFRLHNLFGSEVVAVLYGPPGLDLKRLGSRPEVTR